MIKWIVYIVFLLVFTPCLLMAKTKKGRREHAVSNAVFETAGLAEVVVIQGDTLKQLKSSVKQDTKVKEVARAKKQPKPEKVEEDNPPKDKPKRQKRPDGMERPPEIPRRNDN